MPKSKRTNDIIGASITNKEVKIIEFVGYNPHKTISEIARDLHLDYKNAHRYCYNLYKKGFFILTPNSNKSKKGVPIKVSLNIYNNDEDVEYILLNLLQSNGGRMEEKRLTKELNNYQDLISDTFGREKVAMLLTLLYGNNHIKKEISITSEGKKFLKDVLKKKSLKEEIKCLGKKRSDHCPNKTKNI